MKAPIDLVAVRRNLETERSLLLERIAEFNQRLAQPAEPSPEMLDLAESEAEQDLQATLLAECQHQLAQIEAALEQLQANRYGLCTVCGQAIDPERLRILPYALTCMRCQQRGEARTSG